MLSEVAAFKLRVIRGLKQQINMMKFAFKKDLLVFSMENELRGQVKSENNEQVLIIMNQK